MKTIRTILAIALCAVVCSSCSNDDAGDRQLVVNPESMFQVATLQSLMIGNYDGFISVGELRKYGDIGLGTFSAIDGEMIVLDGVVYQARYDGSVCVADDALGVPFASVTKFDTDITRSIDKVENMEQLVKQLDAVAENNGRNQIYAVRIDVDKCDSVKVRSELPQNKPYRPLAEVMVTAQREFSYQNIDGTVIAVYFPSFFSSQNTPGWHCHFISSDRSKGGHMLNIAIPATSIARFDATPYFNMYLPSDSVFANGNLNDDMSEDIGKVEK